MSTTGMDAHGLIMEGMSRMDFAFDVPDSRWAAVSKPDGSEPAFGYWTDEEATAIRAKGYEIYWLDEEE